MVLLELLAYAGDQLSYLQDRVALEGFLRTATQAESVRKLLRLVDFEIDPGYAAETQLLFECVGVTPLFLPRGFAVRTQTVGDAEPLVYETVEDAVLHPALSSLALSTDAPASADGRQAVLQADLTGVLQPGARLLFQQGQIREWVEVAGILLGGTTTTITLAQPLVGRYRAVGDPTTGVPAARVHGNRARATHGATQRVQQTGTGAPAQRIALELAPLTWVFDETRQKALPTLEVSVDGEPWVEVEDFIDSDAGARHYRAARDNDGYLTIHFGDGAAGAVPAAGSDLRVNYRVGLGRAGHVAGDALTQFDTTLRFAHPSQRITRTRNPLPATAPRDPQPLSQARLLGPAQLRRQDRAVVPADFERVLALGVRLAGRLIVPLQTRARIRHTGSWNTVVVSVDLPDRRPLAQTPGLRTAIEDALRARKLAGLDVRVEDARYCPLHIGLRIDVQPEHFARDVRRAVEQVLVGSASDRPAFFGPGRFRFGQPVYLSDLYAVVAAVPGVGAVAVTRFKRLGDRHPDDEAQGFIAVGALEVARCDNDSRAPELGVVFVHTRGGKEG
jgi:predicted phage baseplate assembly protein